ncbi:MAG TPA: hypothetical protein VGK54_09470, partial [Chloroflexota bacterium]
MALADDITSKGYWETAIRPSTYVADRISDLLSVPGLLSGLRIQRRGWAFPHVDGPESTQIGNDWIGQDTRWEAVRELWRVTKSGQFVHLSGFRYDWGEASNLSVMQHLEPGATLVGLGDSLHRLSEVFEFGQRWARTIARSEGVKLSLKIGGLLNRQLVIDN